MRARGRAAVVAAAATGLVLAGAAPASAAPNMQCDLTIVAPRVTGPNTVQGGAVYSCQQGTVAGSPVLGQQVQWVSIEVALEQKYPGDTWQEIAIDGDFADSTNLDSSFAGAYPTYRASGPWAGVQYRTVVTAAEAANTFSGRVNHPGGASAAVTLNVA